ncbi:MAG: DeoR/GlpR family DNA-binding transcription regulator [Anaerolineales bacterium]|jgi:DeoR/GlpR family transcriptional regulator of sugar metabolism
MLADERKNRILEHIAEHGTITIQEICDMFDISDMTARRDLNELNRKGLLRRIHGGAVANLGRSYEPPFQTRSSKNEIRKKVIGKKAAELIFDGDSVSFDVGTTTLEVARQLQDKRNLTVVTNCLQIANLLVGSLSLEVNARLIITGGIVRPRELSMIGSIPKEVYSNYHTDKAFIGIGGVSLENGLTEYNIEDSEIKKVLFENSLQKIVVADSTKFGVTTFNSVGPLEAIDTIVTDSDAPPLMVETIRNLGIEVLLADITAD